MIDMRVTLIVTLAGTITPHPLHPTPPPTPSP